jgi:phage gp29-like protein
VAREHRQVQEDIERADAKALAATLNRDLIRPWIDLEFGPQKLYPRLVIARPEARDVKALTESIVQGVGLGLRVPKSFMHDLLGIPDAAPGEEVLEAPRSSPGSKVMMPGGDGDGDEEPRGTGLNMAAEDPRHDAIDGLAEAALDEWEPMVAPILAQIQELLARSESLDEARAKLPALADGIATGALGEALAKATGTARIAGLAGAPPARPGGMRNGRA